MKKTLIIAAGAIAVLGSVAFAGPAFADDAPAVTYPIEVHADWYAATPATVANAFAVPQHLTPVLTCGGVHQSDYYTIDSADAQVAYNALLATNTLNSPSEDAPFHPHNYTVTALPDCPPVKPILRTESAPTDAKDCTTKVVTTTTTTKTWDQTLVNNAWVENATPTVTTALTTRPATDQECPVTLVQHTSPKPPASASLAYTGGTDVTTGLIPWGIAFALLGAGLVILKRRSSGREY